MNLKKLFILLILLFLSSCKGQITADLVLKKISDQNLGIIKFTPSENLKASTPLTTDEERTFTIKIDNSSKENIAFTISNPNPNLDVLEDCGLALEVNEKCELKFKFNSPGGNQNVTSTININYDYQNKTFSKSFDYIVKTEPKQVALDSLYTNASSNWFHFIKQDSTNEYDSTGAAVCDGTEPSALHCLHSGAMKKINLDGFSSCQNLTATDELSTFNWNCVKVGAQVFFYSKLKDDKGLKDLINMASWKTNSVKVFRGSDLVAQTSSTIWWTNNVTPLLIITNSNSNLSGSNSIYTISNNISFYGIRVKADNVALVGLGATVPVLNYQSFNNCDTNGNDSTQNCLLAVSQTGYKFGWFENLSFNATNSLNNAFILSGAQYFTFRKISITGFNRNTNLLSFNGSAPSSHHNVFYDLTLSGNSSNGIALHHTNSSFNYFNKVKITGLNQGTAISIQNSRSNIFKNIEIANNASTGFSVSNADDNKLYHAKIFNNSNTGLSISGTSRRFIGHNFQITNSNPNININLSSTDSDIILSNFIATNSSGSAGAINSLGYKQILSHFLVANNSDDGLYTVSGRQPQFFMSQGIFANNGGQGYEGDSAVLFGIFDNMAFVNNSGGGFWNNYSPSATFKGQMIFGNNSSNCSGGQTHNNKCTSSGTDGSNDWTNSQPGSNARLRLNHNLYNSFVGEVINDSKNTSSSLSLSQNLIEDWLNFESKFRIWGLDDSQSLPLQNSQRIRCLSSNMANCKPWDWRLLSNASDPILYNRSGNDSNSDVENEDFVGDGITNCPTAVHGNRVMTNNFSTPFSYLVNAQEIIDDNIGNENGLCESNESCIYSPNIGPYQGEGDFLSQGNCKFQDGTVANVKMYAYPSNGVN